MDNGNANLMTSPQWITYGVPTSTRLSKWYANGGTSHMTSGVHGLDAAVRSPMANSAFYANRNTSSPPHPSPIQPQSAAGVGDVTYHHHHHHQTSSTTNHVDVLPKFPPPMFDIPDIQDSNSVFECDDRRPYQLAPHHGHDGHGVQQRHLPVGWPGTPSHYWSPSASSSSSLSSLVAANGTCSTGSSGSSNSSPVANTIGEDNNRNDVGVAVAGPGTIARANSATTQVVANTDTNDSSPTVVPSAVNSSAKRTKSPKKRKRRDPNEPQKPVSAYSLFFRNAQAAIKNRNPSATFGDVSKTVASMWDNLDDSVKNYYKKQMETAKKDYLKQLAIYRATLASSNTTNVASLSTSKVSEDSVETVSSRNENEADQSRHSPSSSTASLLHTDGEMCGKMSSPPAEVSAFHYSPGGQSSSPTVTSLHSTAHPSLPLSHPMPSNATMFAPAGNSYFPRYVGQRYVTDPVTSPHYMSSTAANGCYDNGSNYYMRPSYPPMSYNAHAGVASNRHYLGSQSDFQLMTGAP